MMNRLILAALAVLWLCGAGVAQTPPGVRVLETFPPGDEVVLARNQNFYLRLGYATDHPIQIWARPYFQGEPAHAGSNPSRTYAGEGEALGWFFLDADAQVDEVRIRAGDGSISGTHEVLSYPVHVVASDLPESSSAQPEWISRLSAIDKAAQQADYEKRMREPISGGDMALFGGFMLLMLALGIFGFLAPAWGLWCWRGGWRLAAAVPGVLMAFVVLRIVAGTSVDPTSHNLWPFEIVSAGALSAGAMIVLAIARRIWPEPRA
jgi:hypothetical protein